MLFRYLQWTPVNRQNRLNARNWCTNRAERVLNVNITRRFVWRRNLTNAFNCLNAMTKGRSSTINKINPNHSSSDTSAASTFSAEIVKQNSKSSRWYQRQINGNKEAEYEHQKSLVKIKRQENQYHINGKENRPESTWTNWKTNKNENGSFFNRKLNDALFFNAIYFSQKKKENHKLNLQEKS